MQQDTFMKKCPVVYVFHCNGIYKIGVSDNVNKRLRQISSSRITKEVTIFRVYECEDNLMLEHLLHHYFKDKRINEDFYCNRKQRLLAEKEWFALSEADLEIFDTIVLTLRRLVENLHNYVQQNADGARKVERILGKDEVTGPIPVVSSK